MTEAGWLSSTEPTPMLGFLRDRASDRKLRLFALACCRRNWHLVETWYHRLAEVAENYADGQATEGEVRAVLDAAHDPDWVAGRAFEEAASLEDAAADAASNAADDAAYAAADHASSWPAHPDNDPTWLAAHAAERTAQAEMLRDIFGRPLSVIPLPPSLLKDELVSLARLIYDERAFDRMPELADSLERIGCTDPELLDHLRGPGPHVKGCWVLDLLLAKQ